MALNNLLNQFNHLNLGNQPANWNYQALFQEVANGGNDTNATLVMNRVYQIIGNVFGQYGSVNVGSGGAAYTVIRNDLILARNGTLALGIPGLPDNAYPQLRDYLTEPVLNLVAYNTAGPGGQGQAKMDLNNCIKMVVERIHTIMGALKLKGAIGVNWQDI